MVDDSGPGDSTTTDLPATHSSNPLTPQPLTEATEPFSSADQVPAPQLSTEVSAARDSAAQQPSTSDLPATHSSNPLTPQPLTEATEPISSADQAPAPRLSTEVSAARDSAAQQPSSLSSSQVTRIALNREIARARLLSRGPRCCKCGPTGTCTRCSCARADPPRPCSDCRAGSCQNIARPLALPAASAVSSDPCELRPGKRKSSFAVYCTLGRQ